MAIIVAVTGGAALGLLGGPVWILVPWAAVGLLVGAVSRKRREALIAGLVFGFVVSFVFLVRGYSGTDPVLTKVPFFGLLGLFGALCGAVLSMVAFGATARLRRT